MDEMKKEKPTVLLTGFGPFRDYKVNSSWEAVKLVHMDNVNLVKEEIPVVYNYVDEFIPKLWQKHEPTLVVHCGVSKMTNNLKIETKAFADEYLNPDVNGCVPKCGTKIEDQKCKCITTEINVEKVCEKVSQCCKNGNIKLDAQPSTNAGRYLCEYIYFASLNQNCRRTVFIHVPELSEQCSAADIAAAIKCSIEAILEEMCISAQNENREKSALPM